MPSDFIMDGYEYKPMIWLGLGSTRLVYYLQGDQNITSLAFICNNEMGHMCPLDSASAFTLHGLSSPSTSCAGAALCKFFEEQNADLEVFLL